MSTHHRRPEPATARVTIGMPVFNGEPLIARAIESILQQSFGDFRLVVLDNASTDGTGEIVRAYARQDPRVEYLRNQCDLGAAANFNAVCALSASEYFKWAAHDDEIRSDYLQKCVAALDADASAVLAHSYVERIDDGGAALGSYDPLPAAVGSPDPLQRFRARVLYRGWCTEIFGLIRAHQLAGTMMIGAFPASDLSLITELCLRGRFIIIPEPLFLHRSHAARYTTARFERARDGSGRESILTWYDTSSKPNRRQMHWWIFFSRYFRMINQNIEPPRMRLRYYLVALRWLTIRNNNVDLAKDILFAVSPRLLKAAVQLRGRLSAG
jgi:glycosyltransferase involved in cell wall biosynthesis